MTVTALPPNKKPINILELFSVKFENVLNKKLCKVRFVASGDLLVKKSIFFSPVASQVGLRVFLIMAMLHGYRKIAQLDVSTAFIYGRLDDFIYITLPIGHPKRSKKNNMV